MLSGHRWPLSTGLDSVNIAHSLYPESELNMSLDIAKNSINFLDGHQSLVKPKDTKMHLLPVFMLYT